MQTDTQLAKTGTEYAQPITGLTVTFKIVPTPGFPKEGKAVAMLGFTPPDIDPDWKGVIFRLIDAHGVHYTITPIVSEPVEIDISNLAGIATVYGVSVNFTNAENAYVPGVTPSVFVKIPAPPSRFGPRSSGLSRLRADQQSVCVTPEVWDGLIENLERLQAQVDICLTRGFRK